MAKKSNNRLTKVATMGRHPNELLAEPMARIPVGIVIPAETAEMMGHLISIIRFYQARPKSTYHKAAMLVDCVSYDKTNPARTQYGWVSLHFRISPVRMSTRIATFRNMIERTVRYSNKPYIWSGLINKSTVIGCNTRFSIGPRTVLYGPRANTYSLGTRYSQTLITKFK